MITRRALARPNASTSRKRRADVRVALTAMAAVTALVLSGCVSLFLPQQAPTKSTPAPAAVSADLTPFYHQVLDWSVCNKGMQCATATAPLDWANPQSGSVKLALIRHVATGTRLGSLLVNPGGPGASGYDFIKDSLDYATDKNLQSSYDIVGFDPRGVGRSTPVVCYQRTEMDTYLYGLTPGVRGSNQWIAEQATMAAAFGAACQAHSGSLLAHVDTVSAARDLDLLRAILGDKKLNYLGYSYGTFLGATYANLYPKNTGRLVLDGVVDPSASNFDVNRAQAVGFENALRAYVRACIGTKGCPFNGTVDAAMTTIAHLLASVDASPIRNSDGRELSANTLFTAIIYPLYDQHSWSFLNDMFTRVMKGDASFAFQLADAYNDRNSDGSYASNSTEAFTAVNCLDYTYNANPDSMRTQAAQIAAAAPTVGPYMAYGDIGCANWPIKSAAKRAPIVAAGSAPIVVVGTTGDPATPYQWAKNVASSLQNGHLVTYRGQGHTAYNKSNSCVNNAVDGYLISGTVPTRDPRC